VGGGGHICRLHNTAQHNTTRRRLQISWGADHRVVDGAALAAFSNTWKALLEAPERLLLAAV
jgi:pyruvate/2-oxoglutarate dehydrogenase complex dihydrolipoamide acyltransferase (E2) component